MGGKERLKLKFEVGFVTESETVGTPNWASAAKMTGFHVFSSSTKTDVFALTSIKIIPSKSVMSAL